MEELIITVDGKEIITFKQRTKRVLAFMARVASYTVKYTKRLIYALILVLAGIAYLTNYADKKFAGV